MGLVVDEDFTALLSSSFRIFSSPSRVAATSSRNACCDALRTRGTSAIERLYMLLLLLPHFVLAADAAAPTLACCCPFEGMMILGRGEGDGQQLLLLATGDGD